MHKKGVRPAKGFDPSYIEVRNVNIEVDSFFNKGTAIRVPLKNLSANERCGLMFHADGLLKWTVKKCLPVISQLKLCVHRYWLMPKWEWEIY